jgi:hypothetical protein
MTTFPVCPCDGATIAAPVNLPGLSHIAYRVGTYVDFRRALLTPLACEQTLSVDGTPAWRTDGAGDLAVMIAEWFAYIGDVITFYNERIANQDYLRTADLPESVAHLIAILGYRPRPAIGATGQLAALVTTGQSATLPQGLRFQSKPTPGQSPQIFELFAPTAIGPPDQISATPAPVLLGPAPTLPTWSHLPHILHSPGLLYAGSDKFISGKLISPAAANTVSKIVSSDVSAMRMVKTAVTHAPSTDAIETEVGGDIAVRARVGIGIEYFNYASVPGSAHYTLLLRGAVDGIDPDDSLLLAPRDPTNNPMFASVTSATITPAPAGGQQTELTITLYGTPPDGLTAAQARLQQSNQSSPLWTLYCANVISGYDVHLASLARQIRPNDWVLFTQPPLTPLLIQVSGVSEVIWDANAKADPNHPVPIPHTMLTLALALPTFDGWDNSATVQFGWVSAGALLDQPFPAWTGTPTTLVASGAQIFPLGLGYPILLQDSTGVGIATTGSSDDGTSLLLGTLPDPVPPLLPPFTVLPNVLPVTRGKTVAKEVLGGGDATNPAQSFQLSQSPVTYLQQGASYASTISLTVGGQPWTEVKSFYDQPADATVFVTSEDDGGMTHVTFGDGVNGARLSTGVNNVVATYRIGAGAAAPPAGKLTVIAQSYPGLRAVLNPLAVGGGADPDLPDQMRRYAPRSVLAFGRAVSVFDYEAIASLTPGVTRARAVWAWSDARQRTLVTVYVGDDAAAATAATTALAAAGDPNRPVQVVQATPIAVSLSLALTVTLGMDPNAITAGVVTTLTDPVTGLFGPVLCAIGQPIFDSQIEAAVLAVAGAVAITAASFSADGNPDAGPLHDPGEGAYYVLDPADLSLVTEPDSNG